jgi:hypothetical protein
MASCFCVFYSYDYCLGGYPSPLLLLPIWLVLTGSFDFLISMSGSFCCPKFKVGTYY